MQFSYFFLVALAACGVAAQGKNATSKGVASSTGAQNSGVASATGTKASATGNGTTKASATSSSAPIKQSTAAAPGALLAQSGGFVTIAGLGVAFAVFI